MQLRVATELARLEHEHRFHHRCSVVMPDHLHLLAMLESARALSESIRLLKGRLAPALRTSGSSSRWQPGFYDHRMRPSEDLRPVFRYIHLNPYRAGLCAPDAIWPGYACSAEDWQWFGPLTNAACVEPEWLR